MQRGFMALMFGLVLAVSFGVHAQPRVISTDGGATQILFALNVDSALVGVDVTSALPEGYRSVPNVGYHRALSPEGVLALQPDLVIGSEHIGPAAVLSTLASADVAVLQLPSPDSVATLKANVQEIAQYTGATDHVAEVISAIEADSQRLAAADLSAEKVAFILSIEPGKLLVAGTNTAGDAFIQLLGASNIGGFDAYRTLSAEALLELNPSLILVASHEGASPARLVELNAILEYGDAAKRGRILSVNAANLVAGLSPGAIADAVRLADSLGQSTAAQ
ncbi:hypothetical protein A3709_00130 [Halioglobus sp. HI00S01]|uniref:heme/hemin ABC transporter substrate-binding protein n=1 Tax=Halioglobus sp. HI00S01 TaxID=1822214 RepID=UPI0007C3AEC5|nr:ABC transporter substrate-binding protein [Halioglobus sp. HI00S01]KZX60521.1 hypothetical protein A3709_00130 [Halioglobus sp. HI00S01]